MFAGAEMLAIVGFAVIYTFIIFGMSASVFVLVRGILSRTGRVSVFKTRLLGGAKRNNKLDSNWLATLRCLSRLDPSSQDLQTLGREQTRLVLLNLFRVHNVMPPLCLHSSGVFLRERHGGILRSKNGLSSNGGSERIRTLSDTIFYQSKSCISASRGLASFRAGWKTALSRGVLGNLRSDFFKFHSYSKDLLTIRRQDKSMALKDSNDSKDSDGLRILSSTNQDDSTEGSFEDDETDEHIGRRDGKQCRNKEDQVDDIDSEDDKVNETANESMVRNKVDSEIMNASVGHGHEVDEQDSNAANLTESAEYTQVVAKGKSSKKHSKTKNIVHDFESKVTSKARTVNSMGSSEIGMENRSPSKSSLEPVPAITHENDPTFARNGALEGAEKSFMSSEVSQGYSANFVKQDEPINTYSSEQDAPASYQIEDVSEVKQIAHSTALQPTLQVHPGLAPPPGFEGSTPPPSFPPEPQLALVHTTGAAMENFSSSRAPPSSTRLSVLSVEESHSLSGDDIALAVATPVGHDDSEKVLSAFSFLKGSGSSPPMQPLTGNDEGFDIMDILGGILNESGVSDVGLPTGDSGSPEMTPALLLVPPSNPWATAENATESGGESRASTYGINYFERNSSEQDTSASFTRMLTPEAILGHRNENNSNNNNASADYSSFYTSLLQDGSEKSNSPNQLRTE